MKSQEAPTTNVMMLGFEGRHWASLSRSDRKRLFRRVYAYVVFPDNAVARDAFLLKESAKRLQSLMSKQGRRQSSRRQEKIAEEMAFSRKLSTTGSTEDVKKELRRAARDLADVAHLVGTIIALHATDAQKLGTNGKVSTNRAMYLSGESLNALRRRLTERNIGPEAKVKADLIQKIVSGSEKNFWRKWRKRYRVAHLMWAVVYHLTEYITERDISGSVGGVVAARAYLGWIADHFEEFLVSVLFSQKILTEVLVSSGRTDGAAQQIWKLPDDLVLGLSSDGLAAAGLQDHDLAILSQYKKRDR